MWRPWTSQESGWMKRLSLASDLSGADSAEPNPSLLNEIVAVFAKWLKDRDTRDRASAVIRRNFGSLMNETERGTDFVRSAAGNLFVWPSSKETELLPLNRRLY